MQEYFSTPTPPSAPHKPAQRQKKKSQIANALFTHSLNHTAKKIYI